MEERTYMHSGRIGPGFVNKSGLKEPTFDILVAPEKYTRDPSQPTEGALEERVFRGSGSKSRSAIGDQGAQSFQVVTGILNAVLAGSEGDRAEFKINRLMPCRF